MQSKTQPAEVFYLFFSYIINYWSMFDKWCKKVLAMEPPTGLVGFNNCKGHSFFFFTIRAFKIIPSSVRNTAVGKTDCERHSRY